MNTATRPLPSRDDYKLVGGAGERAKAAGLVNASWYKSGIPRPLMKELMQRSDAQAIRDTLLWYTLIVGAGVLLFVAWGTAWAVPAFLLYATLYCSPRPTHAGTRPATAPRSRRAG